MKLLYLSLRMNHVVNQANYSFIRRGLTWFLEKIMYAGFFGVRQLKALITEQELIPVSMALSN
jgi:hypothetical protein